MAITKADGLVTPYVRGNPPMDATDTPQFLSNELRRLEQTINQLTLLTPQVAVKAPTSLLTGMIRYNKAPWNPLGTGDGWVRYNGTAWTLL